MKPSSRSRGLNGTSMKDTSLEDRLLIQSIISKPNFDQAQAANDCFQKFIRGAAQHQQMLGNNCNRLCHFLEQCKESSSLILQKLAFSYSTSLDLFTFYMEWNEKNQHRSMRQVLELLATLINTNPEKLIVEAVKLEILQRLLSIITHRSIQQLVKPAFKVLDYFLSKGIITVQNLLQTYGDNISPQRSAAQRSNTIIADDKVVRDLFVSTVFGWMSLPDTSPVTGKLLVTLFQVLKKEFQKSHSNHVAISPNILWQEWVYQGLRRYPDSLENIKNYLFAPLFKLDRAGSLRFLQDLAPSEGFGSHKGQDLDARVFLLLSAMEVGKKVGLVDESDTTSITWSERVACSIPFPEDVIGALLSHSLSTVRSSAFSVLISSSSPIRPFPSNTFILLKRNLAIFHADTDAKIRNEVLSSTKYMVERLKGVISNLGREVSPLVSPTNEVDDRNQFTSPVLSSTFHEAENTKQLQEHKDFLLWYRDFLLNELVPTASYQRHITSLRALQITIKFGGLVPDEEIGKGHLPTKMARPRAIFAFTKRSTRLLLDLLMDPFEDVRTTASELLRLAPRDHFFDGQVSELSTNLGFNDSLFLDLRANGTPRGQAISTEGGEKPTVLQQGAPGLLCLFLKRADYASKRTGRADLADGVARACELFCSVLATDEARFLMLESLVSGLESKIAVAENDLAKAVLIAPIHGDLASIRLVWDLLSQKFEKAFRLDLAEIQLVEIPMRSHVTKYSWEVVQNRLIRCCFRIWTVVRGVLCADSPEGHLPHDIEEVDGLDTKDILSYSFRATHESSNLLRLIAGKIRFKFTDGSPLVPFDVFRDGGNLSFLQLSSLRHRGAFSTVSLTFAKYCQMSQDLIGTEISGLSLVEEWYQGTLTCIYEQASTTRRSAGIPALIVGILSAKSFSSNFEDVMMTLKQLARQPILLSERDETTLSQVHALNSLKEIFKSSALGIRCEGHIADCLQLAAESLKSKVWAIRNCALLLLRSLTDCLFGTSESKITAEAGWDGRSVRLSYERYTALPGLLLQLLDSTSNNHSDPALSGTGAVESVFPALDIIRRAGPPMNLRQKIYNSVIVHLSNNIWHIRDIAARTTCALLLDDGWLSAVSKLLESPRESTNQVHGILLTIKYLLERQLELSLEITLEDLTSLFIKVEHFWLREVHWKRAAIVEAAYEELMMGLINIIHPKIKNLSSNTEEVKLLAFRSLIFPTDIFDRAKIMLQASKRPSSISVISGYDALADSGTALLIKAVALRALQVTAATGKICRIEELVISATNVDEDLTFSILEHMQLMWDIQNMPADNLAALADVYLSLLSVDLSSNIRSITIQHLADTIDRLSELNLLSPEIWIRKLRRLGISSRSMSSPDLSNGEIRISGSVLALEFISGTNNGGTCQKIEAWGNMLVAIGNAENEFETRLAAIEALCSFYSACSSELNTITSLSSFVPSLLALYNALDDDDDEIREAAADAVSRILGHGLAPLAASAVYLLWLQHHFGDTEAFCIAVLQRISNNDTAKLGHLESVEKRLLAALIDDDSLFIEEERNLYIDKVKVSIAWTSLLTSGRGPLWEELVDQLSSWALNGLYIIAQQARTMDGSLGWASKKSVFAICMMVILTAKIIVARQITHGEGNMQPGTSRPTQTEHDVRETLTGTVFEVAQHQKVVPALQAAMQSLLEIGSENKLHPVLLEELVNI